MLELNNDRERQAIPRWRSFAAGVRFGELKPLGQLPSTRVPVAALHDLLEDWRRFPCISVACDVLSAAFATGHVEAVRDIAEFVVSHPKALPHARELASKCLGRDYNDASDAFVQQYQGPPVAELNRFIREARRRLEKYPHNPALWTNIALAHTILGNVGKAERAITVALALAYENRFVVRSACRFFLHYGDPERAHSVLVQTARVRHDPWLLSSEIAMSAVRRRPSKFMRTALRMVDGKKFSAFHLSELTSTLATLEAQSGHFRKARKFCESSLADPAENAIAQIAWLDRNTGIRPAMAPSVSGKSHEAEAWAATRTREWRKALQHAKSWQSEQPFSSRPAILGGTIASTMLEDFGQAEEILRQAMLSNRDDATIVNNLAFALAKQNRVQEARETLTRFTPSNVTERAAICISATEGLISFRDGDIRRGQEQYCAAIETAERKSFTDLCATAKVYLAIEELRCESGECMETYQNAKNALSTLPEPFRSLHRTRLENALLNIGDPSL